MADLVASRILVAGLEAFHSPASDQVACHSLEACRSQQEAILEAYRSPCAAATAVGARSEEELRQRQHLCSSRPEAHSFACLWQTCNR